VTEKQDYFKNTGYVLAANFAVLVIGFLSRPIVARLLGPSEYGAYAIILSTAALLPVFLLFSMNVGVLFYSAKNPVREALKEIISSSTAFVIVTASVLFVPVYLISGLLLTDTTPELFIVSYILAVCLSLFYISQALQQGAQRFKGLGASNIISSLLAAVLAVYLAYSTQSAIAIGLSRAAVTAAIALFVFNSLGGFGKPTFKTVAKLFDYSKFLGFSGLLGLPIGVIDRYALLWFRSKAEVGYYDIANSLGTMVLPFISSFLTTMSPAVIRNTEKAKVYYERILAATIALLTVFGIGIFYLSDIVVTLLLGSEYLGSVLPLKIIAVALPAMALFSINATMFSSLNKTKPAAALNVLLSIALIAANVLLVPGLGPAGASYAVLISFGLASLAGTLYLVRTHPAELRKPALQILLFAAAAAAYFALQGYGIIVKIVAVLLFAGVTVLLNRRIAMEVADNAKRLFLQKLRARG